MKKEPAKQPPVIMEKPGNEFVSGRVAKCAQTLAALAIAVAMGWLYVIRGDILVTWTRPEPAPAGNLRHTFNSALEWNSPVEVNGVDVSMLQAGPGGVDASADQLVARWMQDGWQDRSLPEEAADHPRFRAVRLMQREGDFRALLSLSRDSSRGDDWLMQVDFDRSMLAVEWTNGVPLEAMLGSFGRDLEGIPAPEHAVRFFSVGGLESPGMATYAVHEELSTAFATYLRQLEKGGWSMKSEIKRENMTMMSKGNKLCLVGGSRAPGLNMNLITVMNHEH